MIQVHFKRPAETEQLSQKLLIVVMKVLAK